MSISDIVILFLPILLPVGLAIFRLFEQNLPANQQTALKEYVNTAVHGIEQMFPTRPGADKKSQAVILVQTMFRNAGRKLPDTWLIEWAVEACVHEMNMILPPQVPPKKDPVAISTGPLPVPPTQSPQD
ncbi:MAG: hypothetical protein AUF65_02410 [Chloroflexi bacterium 13_1_20CM_50_12]|nr:MAG: hypothetical protein AUF65_02410 [Chloroflexi bacterium 13_1_20CM_50_12]